MKEIVQINARENLPIGQDKHSVRLYAVRRSRETRFSPCP